MRVVLYNVGRNLNRCYRTCYSFGISEILLVSDKPKEFYKFEIPSSLDTKRDASRSVNFNVATCLPDLSQAVALENYYTTPIQAIDWTQVDTILIGGESGGLPKKINPLYKCCITTPKPFCLTVEAALAIALYELKR